MQVGGAYAEVRLEFVEAAVDVDARVAGIVAAPDGDRGTPEAVATDRPIPGPLEPLAELSVADVLGDPVDLSVRLEQAVGQIGDAHVPGVDGAVDDRGVGPPAVRVVVVVGLVAEHRALRLEVADDLGVGVEDVLADEVVDSSVKRPSSSTGTTREMPALG